MLVFNIPSLVSWPSSPLLACENHIKDQSISWFSLLAFIALILRVSAFVVIRSLEFLPFIWLSWASLELLYRISPIDQFSFTRHDYQNNAVANPFQLFALPAGTNTPSNKLVGHQISAILTVFISFHRYVSIYVSYTMLALELRHTT